MAWMSFDLHCSSAPVGKAIVSPWTVIVEPSTDNSEANVGLEVDGAERLLLNPMAKEFVPPARGGQASTKFKVNSRTPNAVIGTLPGGAQTQFSDIASQVCRA